MVNEINLEDTILYDYQKPHVRRIIDILIKEKTAVDSSRTGTGKTPCTIVAMQKLNKPFLVICPKSVIPGWLRWIKFLNIKNCLGVVNYELIRTGKYYVYVQSKSKRMDKITGFRFYYQMTKKVRCPYIKVEKLQRIDQYSRPFKFTFKLPVNGVLIWDEATRAKNRNTLNSDMMVSATNSGIKQMLLTATLGENPMQMYGPGKAMGLWNEEWEYYTEFCPKYDCNKVEVNQDGHKAWVFEGDHTTMIRLRKQVAHLMDGMDSDKLREEGVFPLTQLIAESYKMNSSGKIRKIYKELFANARELKNISVYYRERNNHLNARQKLQQSVELLKVPTFVEMAKDHIDSGSSVVIFVNYTETVLELCKALKTDCTYYGENSAKLNESNRQRFEDNESRTIICNIAAGGVGIDLHDIHHQFPRISLISPNDSAELFKQSLGRIDRIGGTDTTQYLVFAAGTIEDEVCRNVKAKILNISALNDQDLIGGFF